MDFERIKGAIARVDARDHGASKTGTAFYIGGRYVLTALHVIADTQARVPAFMPSIKLLFTNAATVVDASVVAEHWNLDGDWAVLECEVPADVAAIEFGPQPPQGAAWQTYGF